MSGTVNNPATFGTVRSAFGPGYSNALTPPSNLGAYTRGTQYVPLGPSYDGISETANGLRLSQFNGKQYPPVAFGTGGGVANVIQVGESSYTDKFGTITYYRYGYSRGSLGAITSEFVIFGTYIDKYSNQTDFGYTLRYMYYDTANSNLYFAFDGNLTSLSGNLRLGRHSFSFSGGGYYYNGGVGNRYTLWNVALPSNPFNATGTLAELKHN